MSRSLDFVVRSGPAAYVVLTVPAACFLVLFSYLALTKDPSLWILVALILVVYLVVLLILAKRSVGIAGGRIAWNTGLSKGSVSIASIERLDITFGQSKFVESANSRRPKRVGFYMTICSPALDKNVVINLKSFSRSGLGKLIALFRAADVDVSIDAISSRFLGM